MKDKIKNLIKEEVNQHIRPKEEPLHESLLALGALVVALGASWGWLRGWLQRKSKDTMLMKFMETYDQSKVIEKQIPELLRKFKLVSNLQDLQAIEKEVDRVVKELSRMTSKVDKFVDNTYKVEPNWFTEIMALDPNREKMRLKKELKEFIEKIDASFELEAETKKDALLA